MQISLNTAHFENLPESSRAAVEQKLGRIARLLGDEKETALLDVELEPAPAEGRSATPTKLVAVLRTDGKIYHAEAVKPTPESAADRVRATIEHEIRKVRGKHKSVWKRGTERLKDMMRSGG